jgi:hypothetical protein
LSSPWLNLVALVTLLTRRFLAIRPALLINTLCSL